MCFVYVFNDKSVPSYLLCSVDGWFGNATGSVLLQVCTDCVQTGFAWHLFSRLLLCVPDWCCRHGQQLQTQLLLCLQCNAQLCLSLHIAMFIGLLASWENLDRYCATIGRRYKCTSSPQSNRLSSPQQLQSLIKQNLKRPPGKQQTTRCNLHAPNEEAGQTNHERLSKGPTFRSSAVKLHQPSTDVLRTGLKGRRWKFSWQSRHWLEYPDCGRRATSTVTAAVSR